MGHGRRTEAAGGEAAGGGGRRGADTVASGAGSSGPGRYAGRGATGGGGGGGVPSSFPPEPAPSVPPTATAPTSETRRPRPAIVCPGLAAGTPSSFIISAASQKRAIPASTAPAPALGAPPERAGCRGAPDRAATVPPCGPAGSHRKKPLRRARAPAHRSGGDAGHQSERRGAGLGTRT
jgi:hypothetical protein